MLDGGHADRGGMKNTVPTDPVRSALMGRVRQKGTKAEVAVGRVLRSLGTFYRTNVRSLPGSPDFANKTRGWAVFVHGCFWHRHDGCRRTTTPKRNAEFWQEKFRANRARDARAIDELTQAGYRVAVVWECETEQLDCVKARLSEVLEPGRVDVGEPVDHHVVMKDVVGTRRGCILDD